MRSFCIYNTINLILYKSSTYEYTYTSLVTPLSYTRDQLATNQRVARDTSLSRRIQ